MKSTGRVVARDPGHTLILFDAGHAALATHADAVRRALAQCLQQEKIDEKPACDQAAALLQQLGGAPA